MLRESARKTGRAVRVAFGEITHLPGFVYRNGHQLSVEKAALQVSGSVADFQDPISLDEGDHAHHPVFPAIKRNARRHKIVSECELVIEQPKEKPQELFHITP